MHYRLGWDHAAIVKVIAKSVILSRCLKTLEKAADAADIGVLRLRFMILLYWPVVVDPFWYFLKFYTGHWTQKPPPTTPSLGVGKPLCRTRIQLDVRWKRVCVTSRHTVRDVIKACVATCIIVGKHHCTLIHTHRGWKLILLSSRTVINTPSRRCAVYAILAPSTHVMSYLLTYLLTYLTNNCTVAHTGPD